MSHHIMLGSRCLATWKTPCFTTWLLFSPPRDRCDSLMPLVHSFLVDMDVLVFMPLSFILLPSCFVQEVQSFHASPLQLLTISISILLVGGSDLPLSLGTLCCLSKLESLLSVSATWVCFCAPQPFMLLCVDGVVLLSDFWCSTLQCHPPPLSFIPIVLASQTNGFSVLYLPKICPTFSYTPVPFSHFRFTASTPVPFSPSSPIPHPLPWVMYAWESCLWN